MRTADIRKKLLAFCLAASVLAPVAAQAECKWDYSSDPNQNNYKACLDRETKKYIERAKATAPYLEMRAKQMRDCDAAGGQLIGLSSSELIAKSGSPDDTRTTTTAHGTSQLTYGSSFWASTKSNRSGRVRFNVYLVNGRVVSFHN
jgi:hypothetical protein